MKDYKYAVVIGRFQPVHKAHIQLIQKAAEIADKVIIVLGSSRSAPTVKNPWNTFDRENMIRSCFPSEWFNVGRLNFTVVKDYLYNNTYWMTEVQQKVFFKSAACPNDQIILVGNNKDKSSFYLDFFPQWHKREFVVDNSMNATEIRNEYFKKLSKYDVNKLSPNVIKFLRDWKQTELFKTLQNEFEFYANYKKPYENLKYPVTFITTDVVVIKSGHVLLVRRGGPQGKGLLALPGGFLNADETLIEGAFRELKEETRIKVDKKILKEYIVDQQVFDHPDRSLRGRTITYAFFVKLPNGGELPEVKGDDDVIGAFWMPIGDLPLHEHKFFEDHIHIISHFVNKW